MSQNSHVEVKERILIKILTFVEENNLWPHTVAFFSVMGIGYVLVWYISARLAYNKLKAEAVKVRLENLEKLHEKDELYQKQQEILNLQLSVLIDLMNKNALPEEVKKVREEIIHHFSEELFPTLDKYLDFYQEIKSTTECRQFFKNHILPLLSKVTSILEILNMPTTLDKIGCAPFNISELTFNRLRYFKDACLSPLRIPSNIKFHNRIKKLSKS